MDRSTTISVSVFRPSTLGVSEVAPDPRPSVRRRAWSSSPGRRLGSSGRTGAVRRVPRETRGGSDAPRRSGEPLCGRSHTSRNALSHGGFVSYRRTETAAPASGRGARGRRPPAPGTSPLEPRGRRTAPDARLRTPARTRLLGCHSPFSVRELHRRFEPVRPRRSLDTPSRAGHLRRVEELAACFTLCRQTMPTDPRFTEAT